MNPFVYWRPAFSGARDSPGHFNTVSAFVTGWGLPLTVLSRNQLRQYSPAPPPKFFLILKNTATFAHNCNVEINLLIALTVFILLWKRHLECFTFSYNFLIRIPPI